MKRNQYRVSDKLWAKIEPLLPKHSWMNRFRRIFTRWEKKPENYLALLHLVCAVITYRCAGLYRIGSKCGGHALRYLMP